MRHQQRRKKSASSGWPEHGLVELHGDKVSASSQQLLQGEVQASLTTLSSLQYGLTKKREKQNKHYAPWQCNLLTGNHPPRQRDCGINSYAGAETSFLLRDQNSSSLHSLDKRLLFKVFTIPVSKIPVGSSGLDELFLRLYFSEGYSSTTLCHSNTWSGRLFHEMCWFYWKNGKHQTFSFLRFIVLFAFSPSAWERFQCQRRWRRLISERGLLQQLSKTQGQMFLSTSGRGTYKHIQPPHSEGSLVLKYIHHEIIFMYCKHTSKKEFMHKNIQPPEKKNYKQEEICSLPCICNL